MSDALPLPPRPNLEQYKKLAKDLQHACKSSEPDAIRAWAARWVEALTRLQGHRITANARRQISRNAAQIETRWQGNQQHHERLSRCILADAQLFVAREHGFASWPKFARHIELLTRANSPVANFEAAVDAIVSGNKAKLKKLLRDHPELAQARSTRHHGSTLLHYVSANGVEDFRQQTPRNIVDIAKLLLEAGADVNAESSAYGGGSTTLGLAATSVHPEQAGVQIPLMKLLLDHGTSMDQPSAGGNGQSIVFSCIANGQPEAAEYLASLGAPIDFGTAAALGNLEVVKQLIPNESREQIDTAYLYACGYGRQAVVEYLLGKGVNVASHTDGRITGLHWAAEYGHVEIVKLLLDRCAPVNVKVKGLGATPLDRAVCTCCQYPEDDTRSRYLEIIRLLVQAGAKLDPQWYEGDERRQEVFERIRSDPSIQKALRGAMMS